jgi:hypothetical protein
LRFLTSCGPAQRKQTQTQGHFGASNRVMRMRFSLAAALILTAITGSGLAQQSTTFKVRPSSSEKVKQSPPLPVGKSSGPVTTASATNAKDLQALERQSAIKPHPSSQAASKTSSQPAGKKTVAAFSPSKDKPNPPMNFAASPASKDSGLVHKGADPLQGRLRQGHQ